MKRLRRAGAAAALALLASGCGMSATDAGSAEGTDDHLVFIEPFAPRAAWAPETDDAYMLTRAGCLETLLELGHDGELEPMLATRWRRVDPTTWRFDLRKDVRFQDGTPMDGAAVAGALTYVLEAPTPARSFHTEVIAGVTATDGSTVEVTTRRPDPLLALRMASPNTGILAARAYDGDQIDIQGTCTGPFTVIDEAPLQSLALEANDDYWGGDVTLDSAEVRFVGEGAARATQLQAGEAQIAMGLPAASLPPLQSDPELEITTSETPRTTAMLLNTSRPPFDDPLVRRAIQHAVDTRAIAESIYEGTGQAAVGPFAPGSPWAPVGAQPTTVDLGRARSLLERAGVRPGSLSIELMAYTSKPELTDVATAIQDQLAHLDIAVEIRAADYGALEPDMLSGDFDAALMSRGYLIDVADPTAYLLSDWTCDGGFNIARYCDAGVDRMVQEAFTTHDVDARHAIQARIAAELQRGAASVFLVHERAVWAVRAGVEGFRPHPLDLYVLTADLGIGG